MNNKGIYNYLKKLIGDQFANFVMMTLLENDKKYVKASATIKKDVLNFNKDSYSSTMYTSRCSWL